MSFFTECSCCRTGWRSRRAFLLDPDVEVVGFQADFSSPGNGFFLFNHLEASCGSTLALEVASFEDLRPAGEDLPLLEGTEDCSGRCGRVEDLSRCDRRCVNARAREILSEIVRLRRAS